MQWNVLKPLAVQANRRTDESLFCVGDVKQAIYGWRGGESEILESVATDLENVSLQSLADSRRSSPVIMHAVNAVFENLSANDCLNPPESEYRDPDFFATVKRNWEDRFEPHTTHRDDLAGFFRVQTYPVNEENTRDTSIRYDVAAEYVAELHRTHPGCTIGVLTRSNKMVGQLIYRLRNPSDNRDPVFASEEGGNSLTDSAAVIYLLSALKLAGHPGDLDRAVQRGSLSAGETAWSEIVRRNRLKRFARRLAKSAVNCYRTDTARHSTAGSETLRRLYATNAT